MNLDIQVQGLTQDALATTLKGLEEAKQKNLTEAFQIEKFEEHVQAMLRDVRTHFISIHVKAHLLAAFGQSDIQVRVTPMISESTELLP